MSKGRCLRCSCTRAGKRCTDCWPSKIRPRRCENFAIDSPLIDSTTTFDPAATTTSVLPDSMTDLSMNNESTDYIIRSSELDRSSDSSSNESDRSSAQLTESPISPDKPSSRQTQDRNESCTTQDDQAFPSFNPIQLTNFHWGSLNGEDAIQQIK